MAEDLWQLIPVSHSRASVAAARHNSSVAVGVAQQLHPCLDPPSRYVPVITQGLRELSHSFWGGPT